MTSQRKSRLIFPVEFLLRLTDEQNTRAQRLAAHWGVKRAEAIRRCIDATFVTTLQPNSGDATMQSNEFGK